MKKKGSGTAPAPTRIGIDHESPNCTTRNTAAYLKIADPVNRTLETQTRLPRKSPSSRALSDRRQIVKDGGEKGEDGISKVLEKGVRECTKSMPKGCQKDAKRIPDLPRGELAPSPARQKCLAYGEDSGGVLELRRRFPSGSAHSARLRYLG